MSAGDTPADGVTAAPAYLRVVRGTPTDAELAALVVALAAARRPGAGEQQPAPPSAWGDPARRLQSWGRPGRLPGWPGRSAR